MFVSLRTVARWNRDGTTASVFALLLLLVTHPLLAAEATDAKPFRIGIIGLDTSHAVAFTQLINGTDADEEMSRCRVVAAYPKGSPDIESSVVRVPKYTKRVQELGVEIVDSIEMLLTKVDGVLLETNDGRPHLEQLRLVLKAKKPVFVDKPIAGSLRDAIQMFAEAESAGVPLFSSSSLRYTASTQEIREGAIGRVLGCDVYSPCTLEPSHPDLFWYGIHGVETLFTVMGPGCQTVVRTTDGGTDVVVGRWNDGRIGTFRGIRAGKSGFGGTAFGSDEIRTIGEYDGYAPLLRQIVRFFLTGKVPIDPKETLEIYAFMEAADESKRQGGLAVSIEEVMRASR